MRTISLLTLFIISCSNNDHQQNSSPDADPSDMSPIDARSNTNDGQIECVMCCDPPSPACGFDIIAADDKRIWVSLRECDIELRSLETCGKDIKRWEMKLSPLQTTLTCQCWGLITNKE